MRPLFFALCSLLLGTTGIAGPSASAQLPEETGLFAANPGGDRPDDTYRYWDLIYPPDLENLSLQENPDAHVGVLQTGYASDATALVSLVTPFIKVQKQDLGSLLLSTAADTGSGKEHRRVDVLVIPSGGLAEMQAGEPPWNAVREFVKKGGVLLVFCQRFGGDYAMLPVSQDDRPLLGYGWLEDQSALYRSVSPVSTWGPLAPLLKGDVLANVDGFFTSTPRSAVIHLRKAVSGQPVMVQYRYGKGVVLATTLFTDWAFLHQRASRDEVELFRRLLTWAGSPARFQEPERSPVPSLPPLTFAVLSDHEAYTLGSTATFTIMVWNNTHRERWVNVYYDTHGQKLHLLPGRPAQITYTTKIQSSHRLWVYFHDEDGKYLETLTRGVQALFTPSVMLALRYAGGSQEPVVKRGAPVLVSLDMSGQGSVDKKVGVALNVFDPERRLIHAESFSVPWEEKKALSREVRFTLPADAIGGTYLISAEAIGAEGNKIGGESATFEVPLSDITVIPKLPDKITTRGKSAFSFELKNSGRIAVEKGGLSVLLRDPAGRTLYEASLPFTLEIDEERSLRFQIPFQEILLGDYSLTVTQWDETRRGVSVPVDLSDSLTAKTIFNQTTYRARDPVELSLKVGNPGPFDLERLSVVCRIPGLSFENSQEVSLGPKGETTVFYRFPVPEEVIAGSQEVKVILSSASSTQVETFSMEVPPSALSVLSKQPVYKPGEKVQVSLNNSGGVETQAEIKLFLQGNASGPAAASETVVSVAAGSSVPVLLPLSTEIPTGKYTLNIEYKDLRTQKSGSATQFIQVVR